MFHAVAKSSDGKPICAIRFDRDQNQMMIIGGEKWVKTLEEVFKTRPTVGWLLGQRTSSPLELGAGRIPQMEYFAENEGASEFAEAMASMNGEKVLVFEPATVKLEGGDDGK
jgi:hypothetical protein